MTGFVVQGYTHTHTAYTYMCVCVCVCVCVCIYTVSNLSNKADNSNYVSKTLKKCLGKMYLINIQ